MEVILSEVKHDDYIDQELLYSLLEERTPQQSISHKEMPTWEEHKAFVESEPYAAWYFITDKVHRYVCGAIYLTHDNEIGIFIFNNHTGKGYGRAAVDALREKYKGPFLANINPRNAASIGFFMSLGFYHVSDTYDPEDSRHVQVTYGID